MAHTIQFFPAKHSVVIKRFSIVCARAFSDSNPNSWGVFTTNNSAQAEFWYQCGFDVFDRANARWFQHDRIGLE